MPPFEPDMPTFDPTALAVAAGDTAAPFDPTVPGAPGEKWGKEGKKWTTKGTKFEKKGKKKKKKKKKEPREPAGIMADPSLPENLPPGFEGRGDFGDPYNVFLSTVPLMEQIRDQEIGEAMATAGFTGNRYSTDAMKMAGRIGGETTLGLQQALNQLLYGASERDLDRALQAAGMGGQLGMDIDALTQGRIGAQGQLGQMTQAQRDRYNKARFQAMNRQEPDDFYRFMQMMNFARTTPGPDYAPWETGAEPGLIDYAGEAMKIYAQGQEAGWWD